MKVQKRVAAIHDISGIGKCSLTAAVPIISAAGHEAAVMPTAVLSTHTGNIDGFTYRDLTDDLVPFSRHWKSLGVTFDGIYSGYLGSVRQVDIVCNFIDEFKGENTVVIVDPAMADGGKMYTNFDEAFAKEMTLLCRKADIIVPNITEAAMMTGMTYMDSVDEVYVRELLNRLGGKNVVLTGVGFAPDDTGAAIRSNGEVSFYTHPRVGASYSGTGDIFASAFTGAYLQDKSITDAVRIASNYTLQCIRNTFDQPAHWYGVKFETALPYLIDQLK